MKRVSSTSPVKNIMTKIMENKLSLVFNNSDKILLTTSFRSILAAKITVHHQYFIPVTSINIHLKSNIHLCTTGQRYSFVSPVVMFISTPVHLCTTAKDIHQVIIWTKIVTITDNLDKQKKF